MLKCHHYNDNYRVIQQQQPQLRTTMDTSNTIRPTSRGCHSRSSRVVACCIKQQMLSLLITLLTILSMSHDCHTANLPTIASNPNNNNNNNNQKQFNPYPPSSYMTRPQVISNNLFLHRLPAPDQTGSSGQSALLATSTNAPPVMNPSQMQPPSSSANFNSNQPQLNGYTKATHEILLDLRLQMFIRSTKFDEHFRNLLSCSKLSLHNMFADTYGLMYEHNTEIFTGMFEGLEQYYANGQIKLTKSMENFFVRLYQKIFQVYNSNMAFAPVYLECATAQLANLKPFKDVPEKLIEGIRHAFVAARTFVQALNNGVDIIKSIVSLGQPAQCTNMINEKLLKNSLFTGSGNQQTSTQSRQPPCLGFCEQVISRCIGNVNLEALNEKWRGYVVALGELAMKLSTSYNIETIIAPLDVQISEAIMNFQENAHNISYHVFQKCGQPESGAEIELSTPKPSSGVHRIGRRAANPGPINAGVSNQNRHNQHTNHANHWVSSPKDVPSIGLPRIPDDLTPISQKSPFLIDEIKTFMLSTKTFWHNLPNSVCTSNHSLGSNASKKQQTNCFQERFAISDINSDLRYRVEMHQQIARLDAMKSKIESALAGIEIDWSSGSDQGRPTFVAPNPNPRLPSTTLTASTTTTTAEPEDEDLEEDTESPDPGSGDDRDHDQNYSKTGDDYDPYSDPDVENDPTTELVTTDDYSHDTSGSTEDPQTDHETSSQPNDELGGYPGLDSPIQQAIDDNLITPPNQVGAQRSSQSSNKLHISYEHPVLLATLMSIALLLLSSFQNNQMLAHRPSI